MADWQPIESAPRDGTRVLACTPTGFHVIVRWWNERWAGSGDHMPYMVTYWQPLPAPPSEGE